MGHSGTPSRHGHSHSGHGHSYSRHIHSHSGHDHSRNGHSRHGQGPSGHIYNHGHCGHSHSMAIAGMATATATVDTAIATATTGMAKAKQAQTSMYFTQPNMMLMTWTGPRAGGLALRPTDLPPALPLGQEHLTNRQSPCSLHWGADSQRLLPDALNLQGSLRIGHPHHKPTVTKVQRLQAAPRGMWALFAPN